MYILDTHTYELCFKLDLDAPNKYIKKWNEIKYESETTDNKYLVEEIKNNCKLESNKNLPYLERVEGGLGGNNNQINKQIRFRFNFNSNKLDNDILLSVLNSDLKIEKWTYEELDDILRSFIIVLNKRMSCKGVNGCIEIFNKAMYNDDYFDSDCEEGR